MFRSVIAYFAEATGAEAIYTGSDSFEQQIVVDAEAGAAPNIAVFPQPGLAADMAARGLLTPLPAGMGDFVAENYGAGQSWVDLGTFADKDGNDQLFGFFYNVNVKSLVWFVPENFEDAGYEVPTTMEELRALTEADRGRRRNTVVHWSGFRCGDWLASNRLGRRHHAAHTAG